MSDLPGLLADPSLGLLPLARAQAIDARGLTADVLGDEVDLVARDVEPVALRVFDYQVLAVHPEQVALHHSLKAPDPVNLVNDRVALCEIEGA